MIGRPQITEATLDQLVLTGLAKFNGGTEPAVLLVFLRGYFANTFGAPRKNDYGVYDDAAFIRERGDIIARYNANTDPDIAEGKAQLLPGLRTFYKGKHKNRIDALRAFPEGVRWDCVRMQSGILTPSTCSAINIHDGGKTPWSEGCQTVPGAKAPKEYGNQYASFIRLAYSLMDKHGLAVVNHLLLDVTGTM